MRGEKWEKKEGEREKEREKIFALLGKFLLSYDIVFSEKSIFRKEKPENEIKR